jgi:hypothetical protein
MERLIIISELEPNDNGTVITGIASLEVEDIPSSSLDIYKQCLHWYAHRSVGVGCRYEFVSQSQLPSNIDDYSWDYSNADGIAQAYTASFGQYCIENEIEL